MKIFPAIDLYNKCAVRLFKGNYEDMTVYSNNPLDVARDFEQSGANFIHIVDLEGAKSGDTPNFEVVADITKNTSLFVEIGGGIRSFETIEKYINAGVKRVILGTAAVQNREFLEEATKRYGNYIAVGADIKDGFIAIKGWLEKSAVTLDEFLRYTESIGIINVICTDISKDGAMRGTNRELYAELSKKYSLDITASGGVSSIDDIKALKALNLYAAIIGKAYYTGSIDLKEAIRVAL